MFKLNPNPTFTVAVPLTVPGMPEPLEVNMTFRHKNKTALSKWMQEAAGKDDSALLHEVLSGWSGMQDDTGCDVPYSLSALTDLLCNYPASHSEIFRAYLQELTEAKRKN